MRITASPLVVSLALTCLGLPCLAQNEIVLEDHHLLRGRVVSSTPDAVVFEHTVGTEKKEITFQAADVDPHSFYIIRSHAIGTKDASAHVVLGKYCIANGLYTRARNQFIAAMKLDKSLVDQLTPLMGQCRDGTSGLILNRALAAKAEGKPHEAYRLSIEAIRHYGDTKGGEEARKLHDSLHTEMEQKRIAEAAARELKEGEHALAPIQEELQRAAAENKAGLQAREQSQQLHAFEKAEKSYDHILGQLDRIQKEHSHSDQLAQEIESARDGVKSSLIEVRLNHGSVLLTRSDFQGALKEANKALAVDPDSGAAKSFCARVESSSADASEIGIAIPIRRR